MTRIQDNPLALLLITGGTLGLLFPLGKLANAAGMQPLAWTALVSMAPGLVFLVTLLVRRELRVTSTIAGFSAVSGCLSFVIPNGITFTVIPKIGSGLASMMFALSPIFTAIIALIFRVRPPNTQLLLGVACGFVGAILIALARNQMNLGTEVIWLFAGFAIPLSLGLGNNFRTAFWPKGASSLELAASTNLIAGVVLASASIIVEGPAALANITHVPGLALTQTIISTINFIALFRLQWVGGPTYLSQIGYVAATVAVAIGVGVFGENYPAMIWFGAAAVVTGVIVSNWPKRAR